MKKSILNPPGFKICNACCLPRADVLEFIDERGDKPLIYCADCLSGTWSSSWPTFVLSEGHPHFWRRVRMAPLSGSHCVRLQAPLPGSTNTHRVVVRPSEHVGAEVMRHPGDWFLSDVLILSPPHMVWSCTSVDMDFQQWHYEC